MPPDLCDMGTTASAASQCAGRAARYLHEAFDDETPVSEAAARALPELREARQALNTLIGDLERSAP